MVLFFIASTYLTIPIIGFIYLGIRRERKLQENLYRRTLIRLVGNKPTKRKFK